MSRTKIILPQIDKTRPPKDELLQNNPILNESTVNQLLLPQPQVGFPTLDKSPYSSVNSDERKSKHWHRPSIHPHLQITATSNVYEPTFRPKRKHHSTTRNQSISLGRDSVNLHFLMRSSSSQEDSKNSDTTILKRYWLDGVQLCDFRPLGAPFIPNLVRMLIVSIESYCKEYGWDVMTQPWKSSSNKARQQAIRLVENWQDEKALANLISRMDISLKVNTLRAFLSAFKIKPLHFNQKTLNDLIKKPLYDQFLRPNIKIKAIILRTALLKARTELDTLAFLMTHLTHGWESSPNPYLARAQLADIYGPLMVSFTDRPIMVDQGMRTSTSEESAILEVIMELCDISFWNHLGMLLMDCAFRPLGQPNNIDWRLQRNLYTSMVPFHRGPSKHPDRKQEAQLQSSEQLLHKVSRVRFALSLNLPLVRTGKMRIHAQTQYQ